jgi:hypothetical protein
MLAFLLLVFLPATLAFAQATYPSAPQIFKDGTAIELLDYASAPITSLTVSNYPPATNYAGQLSRINFMRQEPTNAPLSFNRFFVCDLNRNLYILDRASRTFTNYINFEVVFPKFVNDPGYAGGLVTFAFDPNYASNHIFYTVHTENPALSGSPMPTNGALPGLNLTGYTTTTAIDPPAGSVVREAVLIEWIPNSITNTTFAGTARELLRIGFYDVIHPMGDLLFDPLAHPGDWDYGNLYIAVGDGGAGEVAGVTHPTPQRLDAIEGKLLRITPDATLRTNDILSSNGRYRIPSTGPDPNPFVSLTLSNVQKEIYAYGFRNIHRISWDAPSDTIIANVIGLNSWEMVDIVHEGSNHGWAAREGTEEVFIGGADNGLTGSQISPPVPFPDPDELVVTGLVNEVTPAYPVAEYSHHDGDAMANGFVYRGSLVPQLAGKYFFGDITTARLFYCDFSNMLACDQAAIRTNVAPIHEIQVVYNGVERRLFDVVADEYAAKGGNASGQALPQGAYNTSGNDPYGVPYGDGRADIRFAEDNEGELYVLSKSDGMIRQIVALLSPPTIELVKITNSQVIISWPSIVNQSYRLQYVTNLASTNWITVSSNFTATATNSAVTNTLGNSARFYRLLLLP